ncbi:LOW QUALITY PROTEIN: hypothetical protein PHMEG_00023087 [Phytophthora megakarya]|uniref:Uncharacterized protein n=1 Tax=Phytophthora megakarya TaxID=4795 RepID=A0A225VHW3_9STRA|nr:LOW QUALITY PROTEIN: hypothetical protein PHMEG_00023087 [Phytophthora megakarya]
MLNKPQGDFTDELDLNYNDFDVEVDTEFDAPDPLHHYTIWSNEGATRLDRFYVNLLHSPKAEVDTEFDAPDPLHHYTFWSNEGATRLDRFYVNGEPFTFA